MHNLSCLFLFIAALPVTAQQKSYHVASVAFYNFENLFDTEDDPVNHGDDNFLPAGLFRYTEEVYRQKLHNLAVVLQRLGTEITPDGPAVIGTAEIENSKVLYDLVNQPEIRDRAYQFIHFNSPDPRGIDVAMLYHPRYFKVLCARTLQPYISISGKRRRTRDVLYVQGILMEDTVHIFVNHWPSRRGGTAATESLRAMAASVNRHIIDSLQSINPYTHIIVMGDLNDDPTDASVAKVLGAKGNKSKTGVNDLYNPFVRFYRKGIGTSGYDDRWNLFDQIILSSSFLLPGNNGLKFYKAEVFNRGFLKNAFGRYKGYPHRSFDGSQWLKGYSDHFPVLVYLLKPVE